MRPSFVVVAPASGPLHGLGLILGAEKPFRPNTDHRGIQPSDQTTPQTLRVQTHSIGGCVQCQIFEDALHSLKDHHWCLVPLAPLCGSCRFQSGPRSRTPGPDRRSRRRYERLVETQVTHVAPEPQTREREQRRVIGVNITQVGERRTSH